MLDRRDWLAAGLITLLGVGLRLLYLGQISDPALNPFFDDPTMDSRHYDAMAQSYAEGDWVGDEAYWYSPFYPYLVGLFYKVFGRSPGGFVAFQLVLGGLHCGLVYLLGRRLFGRITALTASLLLAVYRVGFFYEGLLLKAGLSLFLFDLGILAILLLAPTSPTDESPRKTTRALWVYLVAGFLLGIASITSGTMILLAGWGGVWLFALGRPFPQLKPVLLYGAGVGLAILPVTLRNAVVASDFVLISYNAGPVFYTGNCPYNKNGSQIDVANFLSPPNPLTFRDDREEDFFREYASARAGEQLLPSQVSSYWFAEGLTWVVENPVDWFRLTLKKIAVYFNDYEVPNNQSFDFFRAEIAPLLGLPFLPTFGWIASLGLVGMVLSVLSRHRESIGLLIPFFLLFSFSIILNFVVSRYRFPVTGILALFSGLTIAKTLSYARGRRYLPLAGVLLGTVLLFLFSHRALPDFDRDLSEGHRMLAQAQSRRGQDELALASLKRAVEINPRSFAASQELGILQMKLAQETEDPKQTSGLLDDAIKNFKSSIEASPAIPQRQTARFLAGRAYLEKGAVDQALSMIEGGLRDQEDCRLFFLRALCQFKQARIDAALGDLEASLGLQPDFLDALLQKGRWLRDETKDLQNSAEAFLKILETMPGDLTATQELFSVCQQLGEANQHEAQERTLRQASRLTPPNPYLLNELAWFLVTSKDSERRDPAEAIVLAEAAHELEPTLPNFLDTKAEALFQLGRKDEAIAVLDAALHLVAPEDLETRDYLQRQRKRFRRGSEQKEARSE